MQPAAPMSADIKIITSAVILLDAVFFILAVWLRIIWIPAVLIALGIAVSYARSPAGYEITSAGLSIIFHLGSKHFDAVTGADLVDPAMGRSTRLFGNGGLFSGSGLFWNNDWGTFRAYISTSDRSKQVVVKTGKGMVLISPDDPQALIADAMR